MILIIIMITITVIYYLIQRERIIRNEKREILKFKQEEKLAELLKMAKEEDLKKKEEQNNL
ncbi:MULTISPECIES: hypothetical protein [Chryseobacterium]|uniref:Uncharacterized protein n=1 Tax=Chryseobacterium scophthalmum TaxID=59733 RepID=A0A1N6HND9_9FLAO|nr:MULTISPECIES: hypothetical protein [Chryseobacterium]MBM7417924.1 putative ion transporter superfamily protein YfcC [Chryseobacterium sp. JUb44]MDH6212123.1 putative ion transporter superfamily protein YfcC [Chryseobacterium sp. BIGb0186]WSO10742.1 hypothetical protein VUJ64_02220 [Chryseobacterium scophthalmum]SIO21368.1 hypothetical protein SAMN05421769_2699 [Chryseobacterium scophthalmum]